MGTIMLWIVLGAVGIVCIIGTLKWLDRFLLRAEEKGWIFYRKRSGSTCRTGFRRRHTYRTRTVSGKYSIRQWRAGLQFLS